MAITHLNNSYTYKVKRAWKQEKAAFENIIRSATAARIATSTLLVFEQEPIIGSCFELLRFEETGRFVRFTADKIAPVTFNLVVSASSYKLSQQQQFKKRSSFMSR